MSFPGTADLLHKQIKWLQRQGLSLGKRGRCSQEKAGLVCNENIRVMKAISSKENLLQEVRSSYVAC